MKTSPLPPPGVPFDPRTVFTAKTVDVEYPGEEEGLSLDGRPFTDLDVWRLACALDGSKVKVTLSTIRVMVDDGYEEVGAIELKSTNEVYCEQPTLRTIFQEASGDRVISIVGNENIYFRPKWQCQGLGRMAIALQARTAYNLGFQKIRSDVGGHQRSGYIAWPAIGFDGIIPDDIWRKLPADVLRSLGMDPAVPCHVSAFYQSDAGRKAWKAHGGGFPMELVLSSESPSFERLMALAATLDP